MTSRWSLLLPAAATVLLVALLIFGRPFSELTTEVPAIEDLSFEEVYLDEEGIHLTLRASGSEPVAIAQVQVDGAYWAFTQSRSGPVGHLERMRLDIPYPWVAGETHAITVLTAAGLAFDHVVDVALPRAPITGGFIFQMVLIGLFVGFLPILVGYGFMPGLRSFGQNGMDFAVALTLALLVFLLIDTWGEAMEFAAEASGALHPVLAVWTVAIVTCLALLGIGRRGGKAPTGLSLAWFIALGIGVHNLGEGIAIGASVAVGEIALASFLVMGFFLHNISEGIAIAAPLKAGSRAVVTLFLLALLAGGPASLGTLIGAFAFTPFRAALAFAVGGGAILQVLIEVGGMLARPSATGAPRYQSLPSLAGFAAGMVVMFATSLLISA